MTTLPASRTRALPGLRASLIARAAVAALLAVVTTFDQGHLDPKHPDVGTAFGLLVVGVFAPLVGFSLLVGLRSAQRTRRARVATVVRVAALVVVGVVALVAPIAVRGADTSITLLLGLETVGFAVSGALELVAGLAPGERAGQRRDAVTMGGLQLVAAVMLAVVEPDPVFAVGVLTAWGAIVAVYLGIAAASLGRAADR